MQYLQNGDEVEITGVTDFDPEKIFECGQCFRWRPDGNGPAAGNAYIGVAFGQAARVRTEDGRVYISGTTDEFESVWRAYFDLDRDYEKIRTTLCVDDYMSAAVRHGTGLRLLRQDPWETLCSFIFSQCNNIPRIRQIIEKFCTLYGQPIQFKDRTYFSFPSAEKTAALREEDLTPIRCGFRAASILEAARAVADGTLDLFALRQAPPSEALAALKKLSRVGDKVASCMMLFGLQMLDAFPVDTWIRKTLDTHYTAGFDPVVFSPYGGIAQQYMFFEARCAGKKGKNTIPL